MIAGRAVREALAQAGDRVLVHEVAGSSFTAAQLDNAIEGLALNLRDRMKPDGAVGIWAWNSAETLAAHLAVERAGLTRVLLDPSSPAAEAETMFDAADVGCVVVDAEHPLDSHPTVALDTDVWDPRSATMPPTEVENDDPAVMVVRGMTDNGMFAIPISFAGWEAHMELAERLFTDGTYAAIGDDAMFLTVQQMMYASGLVGTFPFLRMGFPQVILPHFDAAAAVEATQRFGATATFMVPGMITRVAEAMAGNRLPDWGLHILYGGAPFPVGDMRAAMDVLGPSLSQLYGRFEAGWPLTVLTAQDHLAIAQGDDDRGRSCGRVVAGVDVELRQVGRGQLELRVRSDCTAPSYRDPDGWCALGDVVTRDDAGYLYLHGRIDGMINTGSFHVYPEEVAAAIRTTYPTATTVRVAAEPDERWGQAVCATIQWPPGQHVPSDQELRSALAVRLAKYKVPTIVRHVFGGSMVPSGQGPQ